jgi:hypothetical protein
MYPPYEAVMTMRKSIENYMIGSYIKYIMGVILMLNLPKLHQFDETVRKLAEKGLRL